MYYILKLNVHVNENYVNLCSKKCLNWNSMIYQLTVQQLREESVTDCVIVDVLHQAVDAVQSFPFTKVIKQT